MRKEISCFALAFLFGASVQAAGTLTAVFTAQVTKRPGGHAALMAGGIWAHQL